MQTRVCLYKETVLSSNNEKLIRDNITHQIRRGNRYRTVGDDNRYVPVP